MPLPESSGFEIVAIRERLSAKEKHFMKTQPAISEAGKAILAAGKQEGWVYFIQAGMSVKIGWSRDPKKRLAALQTGHRTKLKLMGIVAGSMGVESALHEHYAHAHARGEWFNGTDIRGKIRLFLIDYGLTPFDVESRNNPEPTNLFSFNGVFSGVYEL